MGILSASVFILIRNVTRFIESGPNKIQLMKVKCYFIYNSLLTSNSFQVVVRTLNVVVGTFVLHIHAPGLGWPDGAVDVHI